FICRRMKETGMDGLVMTLQTGAASPANELCYLAFEYFTWKPDRTYEDFVRDRLTACYGGVERVQTFLKLLHNTTRDPAQIGRDAEAAAAMASSAGLNVRQERRWRNLHDELVRRRDAAARPKD